MIEFLLFIGVWLVVGFLIMRFVVVPLDKDAFWYAKELIVLTLGWPVVLFIVMVISFQEWYKSRSKKHNSFGDWIRKVYGL